MDMNSRIEKYNNLVSFRARVRLSDKGLLNLPQKTDILYSSSPMDFFYKESKAKKHLDALSIKVKDRIREEQSKPDNSKFKRLFLRKSFRVANKLRAVASKLLVLEHFKGVYGTFRLIRKLNPSSPRYIEEWAKIGNSINNKFVNMNIEDGRIEKLASLNEGVIFILNHDNPERDKFIYPIFNSFLNYAYTAFGKQKDCPRPNILVSENIFKFAGAKLRSVYKKMGLIPIDASMTERKVDTNVVPIKQLVSRFAQNKCNLFIFPEGNNSVYKDKTLEEKFQPGIAKIINKILDNKSSVRVVPLGVSYGASKNSMGSVHIGDSIIFTNINNNIFYKPEQAEAINLGKIGSRKTVKNIMQIMCENLKDSVNLSKLEN